METALPRDLLGLNRDHWSIENHLHRNKDVTLGEDWRTNNKGYAPENISLLGDMALSVFKTVSKSPRKALEYFQDNKNRAIKAITGFY